ncbi:N-acetylmuramoyl-L-alanine amidase family protein [Paenibacillus crassostreae]|uniref:N-acetylmuramoyl-L-alanine amidase family protein n=1 Tax=Paenibacillus crassostreae TaxID=1763538 RepID=UPI0008392100|nr:N-acetylmuramoyl-L-alanine amidase family protein [Paenibacillus crassostreae]AOZ91278.1 hypothetical protein LPB68_03055 [Paenibacillus crassostreae]
MKKFSLVLMLFVFFLIVFPNEGKADAIQSMIVLDGNEITMPENVEIEAVNGNVMIPIRVVVESLKFNVDWNQADQSVRIKQDAKDITLTVNKQEVLIDGEQITLMAPPQVKNKSVVVPLRFVSEQMGLLVSWDNIYKTVYLTSPVPESVTDIDSEVVLEDSDLTYDGATQPNSSSAGNSTGNQVKSIEFVNNQLIIATVGDIKPNAFTLTGNDRIVVDLPNTTFSDTFGLESTLQGSLTAEALSINPDVTDVRYSFSRDSNIVRVVIGLSAAHKYQLKQELGSNTIVIDLNATAEQEVPMIDTGRKVVVIDPGHGGTDPGATSITKKKEKDFNLAVALKVQQILLKEPNIDVVMTRDSDVYPTLSKRVEQANQLNADVFVSIHANSNTSSKPNGTETFYYQRSDSKELATIIHKYLIQATGLKDRGVTDNNFKVIRETTMAASLLEVGFLSNSGDEAILFTDELQNRVAQATANGIKEYLNTHIEPSSVSNTNELITDEILENIIEVVK